MHYVNRVNLAQEKLTGIFLNPKLVRGASYNKALPFVVAIWGRAFEEATTHLPSS
jgi:hypothetical protein